MPKIARPLSTGKETLRTVPKWMSKMAPETLQKQSRRPEGVMFPATASGGDMRATQQVHNTFNAEVQSMSAPVRDSVSGNHPYNALYLNPSSTPQVVQASARNVVPMASNVERNPYVTPPTPHAGFQLHNGSYIHNAQGLLSNAQQQQYPVMAPTYAIPPFSTLPTPPTPYTGFQSGIGHPIMANQQNYGLAQHSVSQHHGMNLQQSAASTLTGQQGQALNSSNVHGTMASLTPSVHTQQGGAWGGMSSSRSAFFSQLVSSNTQVAQHGMAIASSTMRGATIHTQSAAGLQGVESYGSNIHPYSPNPGLAPNVAGIQGSQAFGQFAHQQNGPHAYAPSQACTTALQTALQTPNGANAMNFGQPTTYYPQVQKQSLTIDLTKDDDDAESPNSQAQQSQSPASSIPATSQEEPTVKTPKEPEAPTNPRTPSSSPQKAPTNKRTFVTTPWAEYEILQRQSTAAKFCGGGHRKAWMAPPGTQVEPRHPINPGNGAASASGGSSSSSSASTTPASSANLSFSSTPGASGSREDEGLSSRLLNQRKRKRRDEERAANPASSPSGLSSSSTEAAKKVKEPRAKKVRRPLPGSSYDKYFLNELKDALKKRGLDSKGNKPELISRLEEDDEKRAPKEQKTSSAPKETPEGQSKRAEQEDIDAIAREIHESVEKRGAAKNPDEESDSESEDFDAEFEADIEAAFEAEFDFESSSAVDGDLAARGDESSDESEEE